MAFWKNAQLKKSGCGHFYEFGLLCHRFLVFLLVIEISYLPLIFIEILPNKEA